MAVDVSPSELIQRCRLGEQGAREQLFDRYQAYLQVLARGQLGRHLRGKCDPSDVVQMTLLEAHRDFSAFQGSHEPELLAWLRRILAHNLFNEARRFAAQQRDTAREVSLDQVRRRPRAIVRGAGRRIGGGWAVAQPDRRPTRDCASSGQRPRPPAGGLSDRADPAHLRGTPRRGGGPAHGPHRRGRAHAANASATALREQMGSQPD